MSEYKTMQQLRTEPKRPESITTHLVEDIGDPRAICGCSKTALAARNQQWVTVASLDVDDFEKFVWCQICSEDPHFQLLLLANTDIGDDL